MPRACPVCGSRKWRKDAVTGSAVCEEGHVLQGFRSENLVVEASSFALQKRTLKRAPRRNKRREAGNLNPDYYHGHDAELLRLQALQLLLRLQVQALTKIWSLPDIFETVVRDLWGYQLTIHTLPPPPEAHTLSQFAPTPANLDDTDKSDQPVDSYEEEENDSSSETEKGSDNESEVVVDSDILDEISDHDEDSTDKEELREIGQDQRRDSRWRRRRRLKISDTIVTLVIGLWIVRYPVMNVDVENLINENQIPYLDFAHSANIPAGMLKHMNRDVVLALSPIRSPRPLAIFETSKKLARILSRGYHLVLPEINLPPLAWKIMSSLAGSPTTYGQVIRLMALIDVNTSLLDSDLRKFSRQTRFKRFSSSDNSLVEVEMTTNYQDVLLPEVSVAAAWVIVMKMTYGLDGKDRLVLTMTDPAIGLPQGRIVVKELHKRLEQRELIGSKRLLDKQDFAAMSLSDIDRYLEKCEAVLLKDRFHDDTAYDGSQATNLFPLLPSDPPDETSPTPTSWAFHHADLTPVIEPREIPADMANKALPLMPGEKIRSYDADDVTGTLPEEFEVLLRAAAQVVGVSERYLGQIVEVFERRLERKRVGRELGRSRSRSRSRFGQDRGRGS